ncbi:MAG: hypothetical protein AABZ29_01345 [Gemmatimonadota bacterium]
MPMSFVRFLLASALALLAIVTPLSAQGTGSPASDTVQNTALRAYLDCNVHGCDRDFLVTEMKWVNWMRDRLDAEFHLLVTSQATGSGGSRYTVVAIGQKQYAGKLDTLTFTANPNDADDLRRRGLMRVISQLLLPYAARTPLGSQLSVSFAAPSGNAGKSNAAAKDKWNFWTFSLSANGFGSGEKRQSDSYLSNNVDANRTTEAWKIHFNGSFSYQQASFSLSDGTKFTNLQRYFGASALVVKSVSPHWSLGGRASGNRSDYYNTDLNATAAGAVEWDYYPYDQFARRKLAVLYSLGVQEYRYHETTIYDKDSEAHPLHTLSIAVTARQPWGSANVSVNGSQYLDGLKYYNLGIFGGVDVRMGRGFSFNVGGSASRVRDQLYLPRGEASNEEVIARQQALSTNFRYFGSVGFRYQFGSIFNSIVNPRFASLSGGGNQISFSF